MTLGGNEPKFLACGGPCRLENGVKNKVHSMTAGTAKAAAVSFAAGASSKALKVSKAKGVSPAVPSED